MIQNSNPESAKRQAAALLQQGNFQAVSDLYDSAQPQVQAAIADEAVWAWVEIGACILDEVDHSKGDKLIALSDEAAGLCRKALALAPDHPMGNLNLACALIKKGEAVSWQEGAPLLDEAERTLTKCLVQWKGLGDSFKSLASVFVARAQHAPESQRARLYEKAAEQYRSASGVDAKDQDAFYQQGVTLAKQGDCTDGPAALKVYEKAAAAFTKALALRPDDAEALLESAKVLFLCADRAEGLAAERYAKDAADRVKAMAHLMRKAPKGLVHVGLMLSELLERLQRPCPKEFKASVCRLLEPAEKVLADDAAALGDCASAALASAQGANEPGSMELLELCDRLCTRASRLEPRNPSILGNWGIALAAMASASKGRRQAKLLEEAEGKLRLSLAAASGSFMHLMNLANLYLQWSGAAEGVEARRRLDQSIDLLRQALALKPQDPTATRQLSSALAERSSLGGSPVSP